MISLDFGFKFQDLYSQVGLLRLNEKFICYLRDYDANLYERFSSIKDFHVNSDFIIELSCVLEKFFVKLFRVDSAIRDLQGRYTDFAILYRCKRIFVQRYVLKKYDCSLKIDAKEIQKRISNFFDIPVNEYDFAKKVMFWYEKKELYEEELEIAAQYVIYKIHEHSAKSAHDSVLFKFPSKLVYTNLLLVEKKVVDKVSELQAKHFVHRSSFGFKPVVNHFEDGLNNSHYCIFCHKQNKDSCSKGMFDENLKVKVSALHNELCGCPLREKISEMNFLKSNGYIIASLAVIMIDNPLCVLTGHRICNDCTKSCIYQKQEPVNIPLVETLIVDDVLDLPYGFEMYSLLTRWNPLNFERSYPSPDSNKNVLVVGLGPAGIALSHYLLNDGHNVIAIDALKIESLPSELSGIDQFGQKVNFRPIKYVKSELYEALDKRKSYGFGGVAEYGITVRWNKNYLSIARLILERRKNFYIYGGVRFGSTMTFCDACVLGFQHIALALGAGKPHILSNATNFLVRGVRMSSDFLMSLQSSGAFREDLITNLQIRLPIVIIGGGLTAIDCATEALAYYQIQVEKFLLYYEILVARYGSSIIESSWNEEEKIIAKEFLSHAHAIRSEKSLASIEKRKNRVLELLYSWGGARILYRNDITRSTGYRLNSEEVQHALSEGIRVVENLSVVEMIVDKYNHVSKVRCRDNNGNDIFISAKSVIIAVGTMQNRLFFEDFRNNFNDNSPLNVISGVKFNDYVKNLTKDNVVFYESDRIAVSVFGDMHPSYNGSVVRAIASVKNGYSSISKLLNKLESHKRESSNFFATLNSLLRSYIVDVKSISSNITLLTIKSPLAVKNFHPGQFYRLQNFETNSIKINNELNTRLMMESVAVTGVSVNKKEGEISVVVLNTGGSSRICSILKKDEPIVLMGPTGSPTVIPQNERVMLIGGGVGNSVLFSIGESMLKNKNRVVYFAGYKNYNDLFCKSSVEMAADTVIWCCDERKIEIDRDQDRSFHGNIINAMIQYNRGLLGKNELTFKEIDRILIVGSNKMMEAISCSITGDLSALFKPNVKLLASINSPMQCMMKEVCAQCLQRHIDTRTSEESFVYSCVNQDQNIRYVDFEFLEQRLRQNSLQEKITCKWLDYCFEYLG